MRALISATGPFRGLGSLDSPHSLLLQVLTMRDLLYRFARWLMRKTAPGTLTGPSSPVFLDVNRRRRQPTGVELLAELKSTAWACASINASVCASLPPRLFVTTGAGQAPPRCATRSLPSDLMRQLRLARPAASSQVIEEVFDHPILTLFRQVNPQQNSFDLWELTQLYLEVIGSAFWLLDLDPALNVPSTIWILPAHLVTPKRAPDSPRVVDYYEYRGQTIQQLPVSRVIHFRFPDPRDPYVAGLSPLRACFEQVALVSEYSAMKRNVYENTGVPSVVLTPSEPILPEDRDRLEKLWEQKFAQGGQGKALVADSSLGVTLLSHSMGDLAALADMKATKADIANAFHVPLPFLSGETNLANMQASDHLHKTLAILPRLRRRDEKLNEQMIPLFDPSGRLFFHSPDPTPANQQFLLDQEQSDLRYGVRTINEIRASRGLAPVAWGDKPN
ncbi:MAG: phage portal protein [Planctomycetes bacterium]|nr:phage portal protein [Planctomycetota bacterium]